MLPCVGSTLSPIMSLPTDPQLEKIIADLRKFPDIIMHLYVDTHGSWFIDQLEQVIFFHIFLVRDKQASSLLQRDFCIFALSCET